jgi:ligand-binding sensor domain-containing protein
MKGGLDASVNDNVDAPTPTGLRIWVNRTQNPPAFEAGHADWGGRDLTQALAVDAYGDLWAGSYFSGLARIHMNGSFSMAKSQADIDYWTHANGAKTPGWSGSDGVWTLAGDPDGSMWIGTDHGPYRFVAATGQWVSYASVVPGGKVNRISFDPRPGQRGVVIATESGVFIYRGK